MPAWHGRLAAPASPPAPPTCNLPGWTLQTKTSFKCRLFNKKITEKRKIHTEEGWEDGVVVQATTNVEPVLDPDCCVLGAVAAGQSRARRPPVQVRFVAFDGQLVFMQPALLCGSIVFQEASLISLTDDQLFFPSVKVHFPVRIETKAYYRGCRISQNYCATNSGSAEAELWFFPWIILFNYWAGRPDLRSMSLLCECAGGRGLRWQDLRIIHVQ